MSGGACVEEVAITFCVAGGGGVMECEVECEADSKGVRLACKIIGEQSATRIKVRFRGSNRSRHASQLNSVAVCGNNHANTLCSRDAFSESREKDEIQTKTKTLTYKGRCTFRLPVPRSWLIALDLREFAAAGTICPSLV